MQTVDQRLHTIEQALNTFPSAILNALLALTSAIEKQGTIDKAALKQELEELKSVQIENGNQAQYQQIISLVQSRIS
ncbi:hypothetical protein D3C76_1077490 [compost metagenome]|uniref:hypothetical protein n=1 Tax=Pseudomonas putida TaxID=303 RepID=UPI000877ED33|nr:hypothetical protein [Pseudomonas putida]AOX08660.1 hypothetical protein Q5O_09750 [Pseudomonas putida JB]